MKILVFSDSHGDNFSMKKAMSYHRDADVVIHLRDSRGEMDELKMHYTDKMYYEVKGNCDIGSVKPLFDVIPLCGHKFFITHGHMYKAKYTLYNLLLAGKEKDCDFILFGHTHVPYNHFEDNIYMINPGSCNGRSATYGIIEILDKGILTNIANVYGG